MWIAQMTVTEDLGATYPYGQTTPAGVSTDQLATMGQVMVAAREACFALAAGDIDTAEKYKRGPVTVDDSKKSADWLAVADQWNQRYRKYLSLIRPKGQVRAFAVTKADLSALVFSSDGDLGRIIGGEFLGQYAGAL
jgi:hypothetical protein